MKYVVFCQGNLRIPVVFPECGVHSMVKIDESTPDSAGFFHIGEGEVVLSERTSESLNGMGPKPRDKELLEHLLVNSDSTMSFIDWESLDGGLTDNDEEQLEKTLKEMEPHP